MPTVLNLIYDRYEVFAFEKLSVSSSAVQLTQATYQTTESDGTVIDPQFATITVDGANIRYRLDGTDPDSSTGHLMFPGSSITLIGKNNIKNFRAIRQGSTDATIQVSYQR